MTLNNHASACVIAMYAVAVASAESGKTRALELVITMEGRALYYQYQSQERAAHMCICSDRT